MLAVAPESLRHCPKTRVFCRLEEEPFDPPEVDEPEEPSELDEPAGAWIDDNDDHWDVFLPDDEPDGPMPEPGDFWIDFGE